LLQIEDNSKYVMIKRLKTVFPS